MIPLDNTAISLIITLHLFALPFPVPLLLLSLILQLHLLWSKHAIGINITVLRILPFGKECDFSMMPIQIFQHVIMVSLQDVFYPPLCFPFINVIYKATVKTWNLQIFRWHGHSWYFYMVLMCVIIFSITFWENRTLSYHQQTKENFVTSVD